MPVPGMTGALSDSGSELTSLEHLFFSAESMMQAMSDN